MLTTEAEAEDLLLAGAGRITMDRHPHIGLVRLSGQFWPLANADALPRLEAIKRDHRDCANCVSHRLTRMIGLHVVTAAIRLPGERSSGRSRWTTTPPPHRTRSWPAERCWRPI